MPAKINLLPTDVLASEKSQKVAKQVRKILYIFLGTFITASVISGIFLIYFEINLRKNTSLFDNLNTEVSNLENTERDLILGKDRLTKIKTILDGRLTEYSLSNLQFVSEAIPENINIDEIKIDKGDLLTVSFQSQSSVAIQDFISSLSNLESIQILNIDEFSFNPEIGYVGKISIQ